MQKQLYMPHVDGLRAIAVLSVILYHLGFKQFSGGYVGVDIFFVISGFLITRLIREEYLSTGKFSFSNFYIRRFRRLFPAFLATLAICFIVGALLLSNKLFSSLGHSTLYAIFSLSNIYFWKMVNYFTAE
jgi:peptidoglycan/LPS O-acetylase OafA/YrhL